MARDAVGSEHEGVAEHLADRARLDVGALRRQPRAAALVPVVEQLAARWVFHFAPPVSLSRFGRVPDRDRRPCAAACCAGRSRARAAAARAGARRGARRALALSPARRWQAAARRRKVRVTKFPRGVGDVTEREGRKPSLFLCRVAVLRLIARPVSRYCSRRVAQRPLRHSRTGRAWTSRANRSSTSRRSSSRCSRVLGLVHGVREWLLAATTSTACWSGRFAFMPARYDASAADRWHAARRLGRARSGPSSPTRCCTPTGRISASTRSGCSPSAARSRAGSARRVSCCSSR